MFNKLTDFGHERTGKEALGFYLAYLVFIIILGALVGGTSAVMVHHDEGAYDLGVRVGAVVAVIVSVTLPLLILRAKKIFSFGGLLLVLLSGLLALFIGGIGGLIPAAYLTTKKPSVQTP